jgi:hypothetical protein
MSEKQKLKKRTAATMAALAVSAAVAGHAKAENSPSFGLGTAEVHSGTNLLPINGIEHQLIKNIENGSPVHFYDGKLVITTSNGSQVTVNQPLVEYRGHEVNKKQPRKTWDKYYAVGYIDRAAQDENGNLLPNSVVMKAFNSKTMNMVPNNNTLEQGAFVEHSAVFEGGKKGPDFSMAYDPNSNQTYPYHQIGYAYISRGGNPNLQPSDLSGHK